MTPATLPRDPATRRPLRHRGRRARPIVVTIDDAVLHGALAAADLDTGDSISSGQARRPACNAGLIPAVLAGPSQVLDLGRLERLFSEPRRTALGITHKTCRRRLRTPLRFGASCTTGTPGAWEAAPTWTRPCRCADSTTNASTTPPTYTPTCRRQPPIQPTNVRV